MTLEQVTFEGALAIEFAISQQHIKPENQPRMMRAFIQELIKASKNNGVPCDMMTTLSLVKQLERMQDEP